MQDSKIIDVTRSFIPIDPNAYPETMHSTDKEDFPEHRTPVIPYMGYNFIPTGYGYRSYFGTNSQLLIDALAPNKPQYVLIFQSLAFKNVLIALCDTGIWVKDSTTTGAWTQLITLAALGDVYYEWTFTVIKNALYCFRNNDAAYYKIATDGSSLGIAVETVIPNFITPTAQLGIFRLGGRLAFYDGENAIAWCNPDDLSDFTPSVLTGANVTTFNSVTGKISSVRTHGRHAVVYATKSIVLLEVAPAETFFVKASPILDKSGVVYLHQSVSAAPDILHFAYTSTGIYKIESGKAEVIVPEVYDFFKEYTAVPVYLSLLQGRYLCFEALDPRLIDGHAQFSTIELPANSVTFPVDSLDELNLLNPADVDICQAVDKLTNDVNPYSEQKTAADTTVPPANRKPGTTAEAVYKCYISQDNGPVDITSWTAAPCGSGGFTPSPGTGAGKLSLWTTDSTNKTAKDGRDVWTDGKWTMQRFVQYQSAIWKRQEKEAKAFVDKIVARSEPAHNNTTTEVACSVVPPATVNCTIGRYPTDFSPYQFGFNKCSFWLTRYATGASDVINHYTTSTNCTPFYEYDGSSILGMPTAVWNADPAIAAQAAWAQVAANSVANYGVYLSVSLVIPGNPDSGYNTTGEFRLKSDNSLVSTFTGGLARRNRFTKNALASSQNVEDPQPAGILGVETAYCEIIGYKWYNTAGVEQFTPVGACAFTDDKYPSSTAVTRQVPSDANREEETNAVDGGFCGIPFEVPDLEIPPPTIKWEDQTVIYPGDNFLLQEGSIAPVYPTKYGAFIYDLHLKKWGKMKLEYKELLDYSPINTGESSIVSFDVFGIVAGAIKADGYIYLFDNNPTDSLITWGKIGYYRAGMTDMEEVRIDFASVSAGTIAIGLSLDGHRIASDLSYSEDFNGISKTVYPPYSGKWYNISVTGKWDISYIEAKGVNRKGRR